MNISPALPAKRPLRPMPDARELISRAIFDALDTGLILLDEEQRVLSWNNWFAKASGISAVDAAGKTIDTLFPNRQLERLKSAIGAAVNSGVSSLLTHSLNPSLFPLRTRAGRTLIHDVT